MALINRSDRGVINPDELTQKFTLKDGVLTGRAIVTNVGVFTYYEHDGKSHTELRLPEEVFAEESLATLKGIPLTLDHPKEKLNTDELNKIKVGKTGDNPGKSIDGADGPLTDGLHLAIDLTVTDEKAIDKILRGKVALSCGYTCDLVPANGLHYLGMEPDFIQRNIRYNHVAIVDKARAGDLARLKLDGNSFTVKQRKADILKLSPEHQEIVDRKVWEYWEQRRAIKNRRTIIMTDVYDSNAARERMYTRLKNNWRTIPGEMEPGSHTDAISDPYDSTAARDRMIARMTGRA